MINTTKKNKTLKIKAGDLVIFLLILIFAVASLFFNKKLKTEKLVIYADGEKYVYDLSKDNIYEVQGKIGKTVIEVSDKKVRFLDSCCPNKTCVAQGFSDLIICLPNNVIATTRENNTKGDFDALSQ